MAEDQNPDNVEIEPLSNEDLENVAGGNDGVMTSSGPSCCSCSNCSKGGGDEPIVIAP